MPFFRYEAVDGAGNPISGTMDAASEAAVADSLTRRGFSQLNILPPRAPAGAPSNRSVKIQAQPAAKPAAPPPAPGQPRMVSKPRQSALFYRQLSALIRSGISIYQALDNLGPRTAQPAYKFAAKEMADATRNGAPMSSVMAYYPSLFPDHVVAAVRAGETGGFVEIVLDEIAYEYEQQVAFYKGVWLPIALVIQQAFAVALVQPICPHLFPDFKVGVYLLLVGRNLVIVALLLGLFQLYRNWLAKPQNERRRHRMLLRMPMFGDLARQQSLAAFVRMLRRLYNTGIGPIGTWEGSMHVPSNAVIRDKLGDVYSLVRNGVPIHEAFTTTGLFANEMEQLLATGFVTGEVVETLDRVAEYYQDNVDRAFKNARFWMWRIAICSFLILIGATTCIFFKNYFDAVFEFPKKLFPELEQ